MKILGAELYILPVDLRIPLKFGNQTLTSVKCARVKVLSEARTGQLRRVGVKLLSVLLGCGRHLLNTNKESQD